MKNKIIFMVLLLTFAVVATALNTIKINKDVSVDDDLNAIIQKEADLTKQSNADVIINKGIASMQIEQKGELTKQIIEEVQRIEATGNITKLKMALGNLKRVR